MNLEKKLLLLLKQDLSKSTTEILKLVTAGHELSIAEFKELKKKIEHITSQENNIKKKYKEVAVELAELRNHIKTIRKNKPDTQAIANALKEKLKADKDFKAELKGDKGDSVKGDDGKPADEEKVVEKVLKRIPKPKNGERGLAGKDGKSYVLTKRDIIAIAKKVKVKHGIDGEDGRDAPKPNLEAIAKLVNVKEADLTGEQIVRRINDITSTDSKYKIDAKHIKNLKAVVYDYFGGSSGGSTSTAWGDITGLLSSQTDLYNELYGNGILRAGDNISSLNNDAGYITDISSFTTDDLAQGGINLYFSNELAQDAVGAMVNSTLSYVDATPLLGLNLANANTWTASQTFQNTMFNRSFNFSIDTTIPGTVTAALAGLGAGNVDVGNHQYVVTYYTAQGKSLPSTASTAVTVVNLATNGQVALSNITVSSRADVIGRQIWRTCVNGSFSGTDRFYLLATIANNTQTTYTDNIADATINTQTNNVIFRLISPNYFSSWDSTISTGSTRHMEFSSNGDISFLTTGGVQAMRWNATTGRLVFHHPTRYKDNVSGSAAAEMYVDTDTLNSAVDALYIAAPAGSSRIFLGTASRPAYAINFVNASSLENVPSTLELQSNTSAFQGDGINSFGTLSGKNGSGSGLIIFPGSFTNWLQGSNAPTQMRSVMWRINPTSGDGFVRNSGYGFLHANVSYSVKGTFTGTGLNDMSIANANKFSETSGAAHTYDIKITGTGTPNAFQYSIDGGAYNGVDINITGAAQVVVNGLTITFAATTGHTLGDITRINTYYWQNPHTSWYVTNESTPLMQLGMTGGLTQTLRSVGTVGHIIKAFSSHTANLRETQNSAGTVLEKVGANGVYYPVQAVTASAPTYVLGGMYFDTTLNKLRIGGAAGWETVTSV